MRLGRPDGTIDAHLYRKWQGPHWTLYSLALIDYPPGDLQLLPLRDQVCDWLLDPAHLEYRQSLLILGQEDRFRRGASAAGSGPTAAGTGTSARRPVAPR